MPEEHSVDARRAGRNLYRGLKDGPLTLLKFWRHTRVFLVIVFGLCVWGVSSIGTQVWQAPAFVVEMRSDTATAAQLFYDIGRGMNEADSVRLPVKAANAYALLRFPLPRAAIRALRFDPLDRPGSFAVRRAYIADSSDSVIRQFSLNDLIATNQIATRADTGSEVKFTTVPSANDPIMQIVLHGPLNLSEATWKQAVRVSIQLVVCVLITALAAAGYLVARPRLRAVGRVLDLVARSVSDSEFLPLDRLATGAVPRLRAVELWIPATIVLCIGLRWLLAERHSVFGDEAFHLTTLWNGFAGAQGSLINRFVNLYLFSPGYPPVFHVLGAPFVLPSADPILAGRVYTQVVTLLLALVLYIVTRQIGGRLAGAVAVATLLGTPSFVDVSRHYLLEPLLLLEVLLILYFIGRYYESPRLRYLVMLGGLTAFGLLTKFNFFFYAAPLFLVPTVIELYRLVRHRQRWTSIAWMTGLIVVAPLLAAGPWYLVRSTGSGSATDMLSALYQTGDLQPGLTLKLFFTRIAAPWSWNYSGLVAGLAGLTAFLYAGYLLGIRTVRRLLRPMTLAQCIVMCAAFLGGICVPAILALTGLADAGRWHLEAAYLYVAVFGILGRLEWKALRLSGLVLPAIGAVLQLLTIYFTPIDVPGFVRVSAPWYTPLPSRVEVGSEALARDIAQHEKRLGGTKPGEFVYFLYHLHDGPHFGSVEFYLRFEGASLGGRLAFHNQAIDLENIFGAKYLVKAVAGRATLPGWQNPATKRYWHLAEHLPPAFRNILVEVSDVEGRFGHFKAYYVPREQVSLQMVLDTIEIGRRLEPVEPNLVLLWDAQRIIWRAKFENVPGNTSLRDEIDALLMRSPSVEPQLNPLNRQALHEYLVKIDEIRRNIG